MMATEKRAATKGEIAAEMAIWQAANPTLDAEKKHQEALAEGYKDEVCPRCGAVFLAFHHLVMCSDDGCPMKDGKPSLLEQIFGKLPETMGAGRMSRLRGNPQKHTCGAWLGVDENKQDRGLCGDSAVIRCNACRGYFCEECWWEHLHMSVVVQVPQKTGQA